MIYMVVTAYANPRSCLRVKLLQRRRKSLGAAIEVVVIHSFITAFYC
jgi:hypothetical protein